MTLHTSHFDHYRLPAFLLEAALGLGGFRSGDFVLRRRVMQTKSLVVEVFFGVLPQEAMAGIA